MLLLCVPSSFSVRKRADWGRSDEEGEGGGRGAEPCDVHVRDSHDSRADQPKG